MISRSNQAQILDFRHFFTDFQLFVELTAVAMTLDRYLCFKKQDLKETPAG
jgi:hypothetical protein